MSHKLSIDTQERGFWFSPAPAGRSEFDGTTPERPKPTMQEAIDEAIKLTLPPIAVVSGIQGGSFSTGFILGDFIQFDGRNVSIITSAVIAIDLASFLQCTLTSLINSQEDGICFNVDGYQSLGIDCFFTSVPENGIGVKIAGTVDNLFFNLSQIVLAAEGGIGIEMTATMTTPIDMNLNAISLDADNVIFCQCNPVSPTDTCVISVSSIKKTLLANNTTAFDIKNGTLIIESAGIVADIALKIESGATCNLICGKIIGDIIVDSGGLLNCLISEFSGTITNNGTINGIIDGQYFGTYRQKPFETTLLLGNSFLDQMPTATDDPIQVEYGAAQGTGSDPVQIDSLGEVTVNETDQYEISVSLQYGRAGAAGGAAHLFFRLMVDGIQAGISLFSKINNPNTNIPAQFEVILDLTETQKITTEIVRDSAGTNFGGLITENPTLPGWNDSPSASMRISRRRLVDE